MALSRSIPLFAHQRIARLIVNEDMEIDALEITKSRNRSQIALNISQALYPRSGKNALTADAAIKLSTAGFDYDDATKPLQGHPTRNFDEISVRESLLVLRLSDNALTKSD